MKRIRVALFLLLCNSAMVFAQEDSPPSLPELTLAPTVDSGSGLPQFPNVSATSHLPELTLAPTVDSGSGPPQFPNASATSQKITIHYLEKVRVQKSGIVDGESLTQTQFEYRAHAMQVAVDCDLDKIELTGDGKRAAVQAVTAARHKKLLQALKDAKSEPDKVEAAKKLEDNYRAHYAIETTWREERIAELEKRIEAMRSQVKERANSEDKYVEAAMTLAKLHAQGISAEPPKLNGSNSGGIVQDPYPSELPPPMTNSILPSGSLRDLEPSSLKPFPTPAVGT